MMTGALKDTEVPQYEYSSTAVQSVQLYLVVRSTHYQYDRNLRSMVRPERPGNVAGSSDTRRHERRVYFPVVKHIA